MARCSRQGSTTARSSSGSRGNWKPAGPILEGHSGRVAALEFAPDGRRVFALSEGPSGMRWEVSPEAWKRHACAVAGRELSAREWSDAVPGRPYRAICHGG
jgi:hypothetical protein